MKIKTGDYTKKSHNLLKIAKNIFGKEIVKDALIVERFHGHYEYDEEKIEKNFLKMEKEISSDGCDEIHHDDITILIIFNNSNCVEFSGSDFATIKKVNNHDYIQYEEFINEPKIL